MPILDWTDEVKKSSGGWVIVDWTIGAKRDVHLANLRGA